MELPPRLLHYMELPPGLLHFMELNILFSIGNNHLIISKREFFYKEDGYMPSKFRVWYPKATYHIITRGNNKQKIFNEEIDYNVYLNLVNNTLQYYKEENYEVLSYCLMPNHVHLLIKTDTKAISFFMRRLNSMYAIYFNNKYNNVGHLFQDKFYDNLITNDIEMLVVSRYIHLNPVKAKMVEAPEEYKWSSYKEILKNGKCKFSSSELILDCLMIYRSLKKENIINEYKRYTEENYQ